jgi:hypothetical protein
VRGGGGLGVKEGGFLGGDFGVGFMLCIHDMICI